MAMHEKPEREYEYNPCTGRMVRRDEIADKIVSSALASEQELLDARMHDLEYALHRTQRRLSDALLAAEAVGYWKRQAAMAENRADLAERRLNQPIWRIALQRIRARLNIGMHWS